MTTRKASTDCRPAMLKLNEPSNPTQSSKPQEPEKVAKKRGRKPKPKPTITDNPATAPSSSPSQTTTPQQRKKPGRKPKTPTTENPASGASSSPSTQSKEPEKVKAKPGRKPKPKTSATDNPITFPVPAPVSAPVPAVSPTTKKPLGKTKDPCFTFTRKLKKYTERSNSDPELIIDVKKILESREKRALNRLKKLQPPTPEPPKESSSGAQEMELTDLQLFSIFDDDKPMVESICDEKDRDDMPEDPLEKERDRTYDKGGFSKLIGNLEKFYCRGYVDGYDVNDDWIDDGEFKEANQEIEHHEQKLEVYSLKYEGYYVHQGPLEFVEKKKKSSLSTLGKKRSRSPARETPSPKKRKIDPSPLPVGN